jgi:nucleotide-binding universal stress UspA family protein
VVLGRGASARPTIAALSRSRFGLAPRVFHAEGFVVAIKTILVPTDFSDTANAAVRCAAGLAQTLGSRLILLHVVEDVVAKGLTAGVGTAAVGRLQDDTIREAVEKLDRTLAEPPLNRTGVERAVVAGEPYAGILSYAQEHQVDLIVLGTNGRTGIARMLLGSVAERVVRTSPCPVLTVRACQHGFAAE